jgi:hypothetical protein
MLDSVAAALFVTFPASPRARANFRFSQGETVSTAENALQCDWTVKSLFLLL